jgi:hypothetical protein
MELTLVDASNPIREWMERARSTVEPELDEESSETDAPIPSAMVTATANPRDLQCRTGSQSVRSDVTTEDKNSSTYQESNDNSSRTSSNDGNDGDDTGGGTASLAAQGGGHAVIFTRTNLIDVMQLFFTVFFVPFTDF